ncbi:MAG: four helix bundle protein [Patescibacteria group bacterium]
MAETQNKKVYDLEDRTYKFAKDIRLFVKLLPKSQSNFEDSKQLIRSSGSVGANYIEANESFSKKDFVLRMKISRKEAKESRYWLSLLEITEEAMDLERQKLVKEATELMMIFGSIIRKQE